MDNDNMNDRPVDEVEGEEEETTEEPSALADDEEEEEEEPIEKDL